MIRDASRRARMGQICAVSGSGRRYHGWTNAYRRSGSAANVARRTNVARRPDARTPGRTAPGDIDIDIDIGFVAQAV